MNYYAWKIDVIKNVNNKKYTPKFVIPIRQWKKNQKDSDVFWYKKLTWKVKIWHFFTAHHYSNSANLVILLDYRWFLAENLSKLYPSLENSTTGIAIPSIKTLIKPTPDFHAANCCYYEPLHVTFMPQCYRPNCT